jgi:Ca2+-binding EF-hand superfamily protein
MIRYLTLTLLIPALALAQTPARYAHNGLDATSAKHRIERDGVRTYGPRFEAAGMPATPVLAFSPDPHSPGKREESPRPAPSLRIAKAAFRLPESNLGIADVQDVLFFGEKRMVRFRIHLNASGEPLSQRWKKQLRRYFDFLDRDGDGMLNRYEAEFAFTNAGVAQMLRTGFAFQRPDDAPRTFAEMDVDGDGRISFDEFAFFYSPSAGRIITAQANPTRDNNADILTEELFKHLDTDKDGKLSRAELMAAEKLLATLDLDEDECLSALEIAPAIFNGRVPMPTNPPAGTNPPPPSMLAFSPDSVPPSLAQTILTRYDKDKNNKLSWSESPFEEAVFKKLDRNGDGELDASELAAWKDMPPELELEMTLGEKPEQCSVKLLPRSELAPLSRSFKPMTHGTAVFSLGTQIIQLSCYAPTGVYAQVNRANAFPFPDNGKGYVTENDLAGPQSQGIRVLFDTIDRDADGKMTRAEYDAFFAFQRDFVNLPLSLVYSAQTPSLFQVLDANGDGRLSVRELRDAWNRLSPLEPGGKDFVTRAALVPQGAIRFGRTNEVFSQNPSPSYLQPAIRQSTRGPLWFRKFDRNGDGELSRNEFPGTQEEFDRMDTNHDGYISVEEAEAADKKLRAKK